MAWSRAFVLDFSDVDEVKCGFARLQRYFVAQRFVFVGFLQTSS